MTESLVEPFADATPTDPEADIHWLELDGRRLLLLGTAHISRQSVELVQRVIDEQRPDGVCIELDEKRYEALANRKRWELLDLKEILRRRQLATLLINLALASYQKRLGDKLGVRPGSELLAAANSAEELGIPVSLCDRDVRVTMRRAWRATPWHRRFMLLGALLAGFFDRSKISEEDLRQLRDSDLLSEMLAALGRDLPELKKVLIDERDTYLAEKIKETPGQTLVAVVGAGHVAGIKAALKRDDRHRLAAINTIPPISRAWKTLAWIVPVVILGALALSRPDQGHGRGRP
ncbi:MAG: TraB domain-containing protein [Desulfurivibrio sp.]|nr:TraB domain-containing protein [Desulfurivibrio sp.]